MFPSKSICFICWFFQSIHSFRIKYYEFLFFLF